MSGRTNFFHQSLLMQPLLTDDLARHFLRIFKQSQALKVSLFDDVVNQFFCIHIPLFGRMPDNDQKRTFIHALLRSIRYLFFYGKKQLTSAHFELFLQVCGSS
jgi:hypothetical protein